MMKKTIKNLSTMALAVIIGVSAFGGVAQAAEQASYISNIPCPRCSSYERTIVSATPTGEKCIFADANGHLVPSILDLECDGCGLLMTNFEGTVYEAHDYELMELENKMVCTGCFDWYYWNRILFEE